MESFCVVSRPTRKNNFKKKQPSGVTAKRIFHIHGPVVLDLREEVQKSKQSFQSRKKDQKKAVNKTTSLRSWRDYLREVRAAGQRINISCFCQLCVVLCYQSSLVLKSGFRSRDFPVQRSHRNYRPKTGRKSNEAKQMRFLYFCTENERNLFSIEN